MIREKAYNLIVHEMPKECIFYGNLILLAEILASNKSALWNIAHLAFSFVLIPTSSDARLALASLNLRSCQERTSQIYLRVERTSAFKGFY